MPGIERAPGVDLSFLSSVAFHALQKGSTSPSNCAGSCRNETWLTSGWMRSPLPGILSNKVFHFVLPQQKGVLNWLFLCEKSHIWRRKSGVDYLRWR
jgi:hypothetical protein